MAIDFQQVQKQVRALGENASQHAGEMEDQRKRACGLLDSNAQDSQRLIQRVERITRLYDPNLRCAIPAVNLPTPPEALNQRIPLPELPFQVTLIAADGSQIYPDRHEQVSFSLINIGAIQTVLGSQEPPQVTIDSRLLYDEQLHTSTGIKTESQISLMRDLEERKLLARLAGESPTGAVTFTDGPMELWGAKDTQESQEFQQSLEKYLAVLQTLHANGGTIAGYVDKPTANLVVRLLEIALLDEADLAKVKDTYPLHRVSDRYIFQTLLKPGERSAIFGMQSRSARHYHAELSLHFFYLNVGRPGKPWLARIEIPAWVAGDPKSLNDLHAVLYHQCQIMGSRPFPYLIHRAHEAAVVSFDEKSQVTQMIVDELYRRRVGVDDLSYKQSAKNQTGRTRYER